MCQEVEHTLGLDHQDESFDNPGQWRQLVRSQGWSAIYERDFGNGFRLVTFVSWA
jgi:hypothetical protein